jgi:hypothetical protein
VGQNDCVGHFAIKKRALELAAFKPADRTAQNAAPIAATADRSVKPADDEKPQGEVVDRLQKRPTGKTGSKMVGYNSNSNSNAMEFALGWSGRAPALPARDGWTKRSTAMSNKSNPTVATMGIDIGKNSFHVVGVGQHGAIVLRQKWSRRQIEARLANISPCLIGMEACVGAHHRSHKLQSHGHDARLSRRNTCARIQKDRRTTFATRKQLLRGYRARR